MLCFPSVLHDTAGAETIIRTIVAKVKNIGQKTTYQRRNHMMNESSGTLFVNRPVSAIQTWGKKSYSTI